MSDQTNDQTNQNQSKFPLEDKASQPQSSQYRPPIECPFCHEELSSREVSSIWGRFASRKGLTEEQRGRKPAITCPREGCGMGLSEEQVKWIRHCWTAARRIGRQPWKKGTIWDKHVEGFKTCCCLECVGRREKRLAERRRAVEESQGLLGDGGLRVPWRGMGMVKGMKRAAAQEGLEMGKDGKLRPKSHKSRGVGRGRRGEAGAQEVGMPAIPRGIFGRED